MLLKLTDIGPPIVKPSTCFKNLLLNLKQEDGCAMEVSLMN